MSRTTKIDVEVWLGIFWASVIVLAMAGLIFLATPAHAQQTPPTRVITGVGAAQIQSALIERCISQGWQIETQTPNQVVCTHAADSTANFWMTPLDGQGRPPRWILAANYAQTAAAPSDTVVSIEMYLQAYLFTGQPGRREPMRRNVRQELERLLDALQALQTTPAPETP